MNDQFVGRSQGDFPDGSQDLSMLSSGGFAPIHKSEISPIRHAPEGCFTAYSYWPGDVAGQSRQNPSQQSDYGINASQNFADFQLRNPLEQRFTSYSYWPGETISQSQDQAPQDLDEPQVRVPLGERFTSYWQGGTVDDGPENQVQQLRYGLSIAHNTGGEMFQSPSERHTNMHPSWCLSHNPFEHIPSQTGCKINGVMAAN
jgi:hypothetical protein